MVELNETVSFPPVRFVSWSAGKLCEELQAHSERRRDLTQGPEADLNYDS